MNAKTDINIADKKPKDLKKIRSLISKYKNKALDISSNTLEGRILKTLIISKNNTEINPNDDDKDKANFTTQSFNNYNENSFYQNLDSNLRIDLNLESHNSIELFGQIKKVVEYNTNYANKRENEKSQNELEGKLNHIGEDNKMMRNQSELSIFSKFSIAADNIKILNEFKNNIENKIGDLKKKLELNNYVNSQFITINYEKLKNLKSLLFINILSYFDTNDLFHMINLNKEIKLKIIDIMKEISKTLIHYFDNKYIKLFKIEQGFLSFKKIKKNKKSHLKINLIIKSKILSNNNLIDKSITIGFKSKFPSDKEIFNNVFKFDVMQPGPLSFWIMREYTNFHQDELNKAYFQHIMKFCINDFIEMTINIFTEKGLMDFCYFKWMSPNIKKNPNINFLEFSNDHNRNREVLDFDLSRFCELEIMKNKWNDLSNMINHDIIFERIKCLFEPFLLVQKVLYDDVGYFVFKIFLVANIKGKIQSSEELGIIIEVLELNEKISNEVKKNCLIFDRKNELQCRIGDLVVFYISKNK